MHVGKLELPDAGLYLQDGVLVRLNDKGVMTGRYAVEDVMVVQAEKVTDWAAIMTSFVILGLAVVAKIYMTSVAWSWVVSIALGFFSGLMLLVAKDTLLRLMTKDGEVAFKMSGDDEDVEAFVVSFKAAVRRYQEERKVA